MMFQCQVIPSSGEEMSHWWLSICWWMSSRNGRMSTTVTEWKYKWNKMMIINHGFIMKINSYIYRIIWFFWLLIVYLTLLKSVTIWISPEYIFPIIWSDQIILFILCIWCLDLWQWDVIIIINVPSNLFEILHFLKEHTNVDLIPYINNLFTMRPAILPARVHDWLSDTIHSFHKLQILSKHRSNSCTTLVDPPGITANY